MKFLVYWADTERQIPHRAGVEFGMVSRTYLEKRSASEFVVDAKNKRVRVKFLKKLTLEE